VTPAAGIALGPVCVLGVDPGGRNGTGLTLRARGGRYLAHLVVKPKGDEADSELGVGPVYLADVRAGGLELLAHWARTHPDSPPPLVATEAVVAPRGFDITARRSGKLSPVRPADVMALAFVLGGVLMAWPDALVVPHGGYGRRPLSSYPAELVTDGERAVKHPLGMHRPAGKKADTDHARSAWDIAGTAERLARSRSGRWHR
jgi:hypothetical protein